MVARAESVQKQEVLTHEHRASMASKELAALMKDPPPYISVAVSDAM